MNGNHFGAPKIAKLDKGVFLRLTANWAGWVLFTKITERTENSKLRLLRLFSSFVNKYVMTKLTRTANFD